jgi:hypothetical protein
MKRHATPRNAMQRHATPCNAMHRHALFSCAARMHPMRAVLGHATDWRCLCMCPVVVQGHRTMPALSHTAAAGLWELLLINGGGSCYSMNIEAARSCVKLERLAVSGYTVDFSPLAGCVLQEISLYRCMISDLSPLGTCAHLKKLSFLEGTSLSDLNQLQGCAAQLHELNISNSHYLLSLEGIQACGKLQVLNMAHCSVESLAPLSRCALLKKVNMVGCEYIMHGCNNVPSVEPLKACGQLEELSIGRRDPPGLEALVAALPRLRVDDKMQELMVLV